MGSRGTRWTKSMFRLPNTTMRFATDWVMCYPSSGAGSHGLQCRLNSAETSDFVECEEMELSACLAGPGCGKAVCVLRTLMFPTNQGYRCRPRRGGLRRLSKAHRSTAAQASRVQWMGKRQLFLVRQAKERPRRKSGALAHIPARHRRVVSHGRSQGREMPRGVRP